MDDNGNWHEEHRGMEDIVVSYFMKLFSSNGVENFDDILCHIIPKVTEDMNNSLESLFMNILCHKCILRKF
ncbi:hypothetical protein ACFX15_034016 [Malus domestica]